MPVPLPVPPLLSMLSHKSTGIRKTHLLWVTSSHSSCRSGISMWCCSQGTKAFPSEGSVRFFWAGFPISKTWFAHSGPQVRGRSQKEKRQLRWGWQQRGETKLQLLSHGPTVARFFFLENPRKKCWPTNSFFFYLQTPFGGKHTPSVGQTQWADTYCSSVATTDSVVLYNAKWMDRAP